MWLLHLQLIQNHAAPSHGPPARVLPPLFFPAKSLLLPKPRGKKKHPKTTWSSLLSFRTVWSFSPFQNRVALSLSPQNRVVFPTLPVHFIRTAWTSTYLLASELRALSPFTSPKLPDPLLSPPKPCGPLFPFIRTTWTSIYLLQNHMVLFLSPQNLVVLSLWLLCLGLNPSTHLPLQPHFRLLLQSATPASIPVFFQLFWAAIVSLGRCGPMAWSQSSPSSHAGPVTRGSCFPVPSWVEFDPIPLAQSMATAI